MAPSGNFPKASQRDRPRQVAQKAIVPVIPLPFIQKRKQQLAACEKAKEEASQLPAVVVEPVRISTPPTSESTFSAADSPPNIHSCENVEEEAQPVKHVEPVESVEEATLIVDEVGEEGEEVEETVNGAANGHNVQEEQEPSVQEETSDEQHEPQPSTPSKPPSSASRSTFQMPPPPSFVPANYNQTNNIADSVRLPPGNMLNGIHSMHHAHPSAGSLMFGGYPESNNSSPAPPPSAGNVPPYQFQQQQQVGRHGPHLSNGSHGQHMSNGYSQMGPPPPPGYYPRHDTFQGPPADNYARRQMTSFRPPDGYSPSATPLGFDNQRAPIYDLSTPHSFHGSQSSVPNEQENGSAFYGQYPTAIISNGSNGHIDDVRLYQQPRQEPGPTSQHIPTQNNFPVGQPQGGQTPDNYDGLLVYLQNQFAVQEFADYVLELRYSDDRAAPVRIYGHNLMFARSPTLKSLMQAQAQESNGPTTKSLFIVSDDRFLRSDGFWMAVQRLYGGRLLDFGAAAMKDLPRKAGQSGPITGTPAERFDIALGYAAAGQILGIPPVVARGVEIASMLVNWDTIEKAIDFAIDGGLDSQWIYSQSERVNSPSTYGPNVNMLIFTALSFLVQSFPPDFELDRSVREPKYNRRLPHVPEERPSMVNPRLVSIKFGDHPSEETVRQESGSSVSTTLSKVLINLPYHLLKYVLESPHLGNVEGWANNNLRQKSMYSVIEERERRRMRVLQNGTIGGQSKDVFDDSVRWQEAVDPGRGPDRTPGTPTLTRSWHEAGFPVSSA